MGKGTPEAFPTKLVPMAAQSAKAPFRDPAWLFEPKLDGYRILAFLQRGAVSLVSRRGLAYTRMFPSIAAELQSVSDADCIFDGEIIALGSDGRPSFNALQNRAGLSTDGEIAAAERRAPALFFCFDLLHEAGRNLRGLPYVERRRLLHARVRPTAHVKLVDAHDDGVALYAAALDTGFEGVVAKRKLSLYQAGQRSPDWLKVKHTHTGEFVIGGFSKGKGERERFGSLVVGYWDDADTLRYAGNVGSGYDEGTIADLLARVAPLVVPRSPFAEKVPVRAGTTWLRPELVAEVAYADWTPDARLRAPVFVRMRGDVDPRSIRRGGNLPADAVAPPRAVAATASQRATTDSRPASRTQHPNLPDATELRRLLAALEQPLSTLEVGGHSIRLSNLQRVYWPEVPELGQAATSKLDLIRYLIRMAPLMLPHLRDRPLTLFRWPGGIGGRRMLQKHPESALPAYVETATVFSETKGVDDAYLLCNNLATLVWLAERGVLEVHTWHSRVSADDAPAVRSVSSGSAAELAQSAVNFPDYMLFDLDPYIYSGSERSGAEPEPNREGFEQAKRVAFWLRDVLHGMALESSVKTSGKTGLHVVVPIERTLSFDVVRRMAAMISKHVMSEHAAAITTEWSTAERIGKVFIDFNMNVRGKSISAPYGPRGLPGAPVSMPLSWRELEDAQPVQFRIATVNVDRKRGDPWSAVFDGKQSLEATLSTGR